MEQKIVLTLTERQAENVLQGLASRWSRMDDLRKEYSHDSIEYKNALETQQEIEPVMEVLRNAL